MMSSETNTDDVKAGSSNAEKDTRRSQIVIPKDSSLEADSTTCADCYEIGVIRNSKSPKLVDLCSVHAAVTTSLADSKDSLPQGDPNTPRCDGDWYADESIVYFDRGDHRTEVAEAVTRRYADRIVQDRRAATALKGLEAVRWRAEQVYQLRTELHFGNRATLYSAIIRLGLALKIANGQVTKSSEASNSPDDPPASSVLHEPPSPQPAPEGGAETFTSSDGILIHRAEFLVCDPCVKLKGQECHTPECVFCFQPVSVARAVLDKTLNCPIIDGKRIILLSAPPTSSRVEGQGDCPTCSRSRDEAIAWLKSIGADTDEERVLLAQFLATQPTVEQIHLATSLAIQQRDRAGETDQGEVGKELATDSGLNSPSRETTE